MQVGLPLAACVAVACSGMSAARLRRLRRLGPGDVGAVAKVLATGEASKIDAALVGHETMNAEGAALVRAALEAPGVTWVGVVNEHLSDAAHAIDEGSGAAKAAARVCLATGTLVAVLGVASGSGAGAFSMAAPASAFLLGLAGALVTVEFGRRGDRLAAERRREWDRLSTALSRYLSGRP